MTTGRINQVTTFRSAFAAIIYSRVTSTRFHDVEFIIFSYQDPSQLRDTFLLPRVQASLNQRVASPHFPFSHVSSEIPSSSVRTKVTHLQWGLPTTGDVWKTHTDVADPLVASCIRHDHRQAIHLLQTLLKHITQGRLKASKHNHQGQFPFESGLPRSRTHWLDGRQPSQPL